MKVFSLECFAIAIQYKIFEVLQDFQEMPMKSKIFKDKIFEARQKSLKSLKTLGYMVYGRQYKLFC